MTLLRYGFSNYTSVRDYQELSLVAGPLTRNSSNLIELDSGAYKALRTAAVYGPNASGKSNVLSGLNFMRSAVRNSHRKWDPGSPVNRHHFALDDSRSRPSDFMVEIVLKGIRFEYGFSVNDERVLEEYLYAYPGNRKQRWFERSVDSQQMSFGKHLTGENRTIESLTRPNSLFLSAAAQNNHEKLLPIYSWFSNSLIFRSGLQDGLPANSLTVDLCLKDQDKKRSILELLQGADLGIVGIDIKEEDLDPKFNVFAEKLHALLVELEPESSLPQLDMKRTVISLQHRAQAESSINLQLGDESSGTLTYLALLGPAIQTLDRGGVLCVDELDASLHPLLVTEFVKLFSDPKRNPRGAQLIFSTHSTELLDSDVLLRDEIWLTEKDRAGITRLYPLSDFKPRKGENLQRGYLQGRYGATPFLVSPFELETK